MIQLNQKSEKKNKDKTHLCFQMLLILVNHFFHGSSYSTSLQYLMLTTHSSSTLSSHPSFLVPLFAGLFLSSLSALPLLAPQALMCINWGSSSFFAFVFGKSLPHLQPPPLMDPVSFIFLHSLILILYVLM